jgi:hypothetical protein
MIRQVFNPESVSRLQRTLGKSGRRELARRLEVITASGPLPSDPGSAYNLRRILAEKAALDTYLEAADLCGMLDNETLGKLRDPNPNNYRSARAEALACWFFAGRLGLQVHPRPAGRNGCVLDLRLVRDVGGDVYVEIKAPYVEPPANQGWSGNDACAMVGALQSAQGQFASGQTNLLCIVPEVRVPVAAERNQLVEAFIGQPVMSFKVDVRTGAPVGDTRTVFRPDGRFVRGAKKEFTRVSAVVSIEEVIEEQAHEGKISRRAYEAALARGDERILWAAALEWLQMRYSGDHRLWVGHQVIVLHNPFAECPLDEDLFEGFPQLVVRGDNMVWTDRIDGRHPHQ